MDGHAQALALSLSPSLPLCLVPGWQVFWLHKRPKCLATVWQMQEDSSEASGLMRTLQMSLALDSPLAERSRVKAAGRAVLQKYQETQEPECCRQMCSEIREQKRKP